MRRGDCRNEGVTQVSDRLRQEKMVTRETLGDLLVSPFLACFNMTLVNSTFQW